MKSPVFSSFQSIFPSLLIHGHLYLSSRTSPLCLFLILSHSVLSYSCHEVPLFPSSFPSLVPNSLLMPIWRLPDARSLFTWSLSHIIVLLSFLHNMFTYLPLCGEVPCFLFIPVYLFPLVLTHGHSYLSSRTSPLRFTLILSLSPYLIPQCSVTFRSLLTWLMVDIARDPLVYIGSHVT